VTRHAGDLRAALRRIIERIWILVVPRGTNRLAAVQIWFADGEHHRDYFVFHRPPRSNGKATKPGFWRAWSLAEVAVPGDLDLRDRGHARRLEKALTELDLATLSSGE
jgi:hypothetical protein